MGAAVTRLAARKARKKYGTRVIYTAHGFHFFKGAPVQNWLLYYPVEQYMARHTDALITINKEDYDFAKRNFKADVRYVPGVGIDEKKFDLKMSDSEKRQLRNTLGLTVDDFVMIFPAEISNRKRHIWLINCLEDLIKKHPNIHLLLPGSDRLDGAAQLLVKNLSLSKNIHFLGFRKDIPKLLMVSDLAISSSRQEGLPVNIMEAMFAGLPIVVSDSRGNRDLVVHGQNGYVIPIDDQAGYAAKIEDLYNNRSMRQSMGKASKEMVEPYLMPKIMDQMIKIYRRPWRE